MICFYFNPPYNMPKSYQDPKHIRTHELQASLFGKQPKGQCYQPPKIANGKIPLTLLNTHIDVYKGNRGKLNLFLMCDESFDCGYQIRPMYEKKFVRTLFDGIEIGYLCAIEDICKTQSMNKKSLSALFPQGK